MGRETVSRTGQHGSDGVLSFAEDLTDLERGEPLGVEQPQYGARVGAEDRERKIPQVPALRYAAQDPGRNRYFFPERNATMSALTKASIIVEAGETSGTLYQARAALDQGRKLFILDSCFERGLSWPEKLQAQGAVRVSNYDDIRASLPPKN